MWFNQIISNPPYNVGNKITSAAISSCDKCVCLMPLSCYKNKSNELWRYVESMELADPKMFADATITDNLCICTLLNETVDKFKTYEELEMESFDEGFRLFFEKNVPGKTIIPIDKCTKRFKTVEEGRKFFPSDSENLVFFGVRTLSGGISKNSFDYKYNTNLCGNEELPFSKNEENYCMGGRLFRLKSGVAKNNLVLWLYNGELANKIRNARNADTRKCDGILPNIDWEGISETPLWKEGKYDEAILSEMHLRWNDDKSGVVRKENYDI